MNSLKSKLKLIKIILLIIVPIVFASCGKTDPIILSGTVESTQIELNSEVQGKVIELLKEEGAQVKTDEPVVSVDSSLQELAVKQQEAVVKLKQANLDNLKSGSRIEEIKQAEASSQALKANLDELKAGTRPEQIAQAKASVKNAEIAVETAELNYNYALDKYNQIKDLYDSNSASENDVTDLKLKLDTSNKQLEAAKEQLKSSQSNLQLLINGPTNEAIQAAQSKYNQALAQLELLKNGSTGKVIESAEADLEQSTAALEQSKIVLSKYEIKSPVDGTYILKNVNIGDIVSSGTSIGTVSDLNDLWVNFYIPEKYLHLVSMNKIVELKTPSLDDKKISGKIVSISDKSEFTPKNIETTESKTNTVFKIKIEILDNIDVLRPGMTIEALIPKSTSKGGSN